MKVYNIGIIGAGRIGKVHSESLIYHVKNANVKSIADPFLDKNTKNWAKLNKIEEVYEDYKKILNDSDIDAVFVCSSTDTHSKISIEAMKSGKHVFCEKPVDFDLKRISDVLEVQKNTKVKFQVGFNRRFDHNFRTLRNTIKSGKIGEIHIIKITSRDPQPPPLSYVKVSGGIFLDMTIHDFDMVRYLSESEVVEVNAIGGVLIDSGFKDCNDVDTAIVTLKLENGAMAIIDNSRKAPYGYDQRAEVFGSLGSASISNDFLSTTVLATKSGEIKDNMKSNLLDRYLQSYVDEAKAFIEAINLKKEVEVNGYDGLKPVIIGLAAKKSLIEKKAICI